MGKKKAYDIAGADSIQEPDSSRETISFTQKDFDAILNCKFHNELQTDEQKLNSVNSIRNSDEILEDQKLKEETTEPQNNRTSLTDVDSTPEVLETQENTQFENNSAEVVKVIIPSDSFHSLHSDDQQEIHKEAIILNSQDVDPSLEIVSLKSENDDSVSQRSAVEIVEKKISNENLQPAIGVIPDEHFTSIDLENTENGCDKFKAKKPTKETLKRSTLLLMIIGLSVLIIVVISVLSSSAKTEHGLITNSEPTPEKEEEREPRRSILDFTPATDAGIGAINDSIPVAQAENSTEKHYVGESGETMGPNTTNATKRETEKDEVDKITILDVTPATVAAIGAINDSISGAQVGISTDKHYEGESGETMGPNTTIAFVFMTTDSQMHTSGWDNKSFSDVSENEDYDDYSTD